MSTTGPLSKIGASDATRFNLRYPKWNRVIPIPPESLMWSVGGTSIENFLVVGDAWAQLLSHFTTPGCTVLDIGCGCGRTARLITTNHHVNSYIGFDVIPDNIEWCRNFIGVEPPRRFIFHHFDLRSATYNPTGTVKVRDFRFPCQDRSVHLAFAASVFTHLLEPDARHYLREIARVLATGGRAILSIHVETPPGHSWHGTEDRIDIAPASFVAAANEAGLQLEEQAGEVCGQEAFIFRSK